MRRKPDPYLRCQPWKVLSVFDPIERVLHRMEADGTVETTGRQIVFREDGKGGWYDLVAALAGVIEFHQIAASRYGLPCDVGGMVRLAKKLDLGSPIFAADVAAVRESIASCKAQAMQLRVSQATSVVDTVRISMEMDRVRVAGVAA